MAKKFFKIPTVKSRLEMDEYVKCMTSLYYFIWHYVKIVTLKDGLVPFLYYPFQLAVLRAFRTHKYNIALKPRQMGLTTLTCAYVLWLALFHPHKNILLISIKASVAKAMLRKIKLMYRHLPSFLQMEVLNGSSAEVGTATEIRFVNGSTIAISAATEDAGRSEALSCLVMDEVAFQRYASTIWSSAQQTLATGGQAIMFSTAFGVGNFFHNEWTRAVAGLNGFFPIKLNWRMHPSRNDAWYLEQRQKLGEKRTAQEIDCDFLKSGYNVFDLIKIKAIEDRLYETPVLDSFDNDQGKVYFDPVPGVAYSIGGDIASGRSRDYSTFSIFDGAGKEHACYKGKLNPHEYGKLLMKWGQRYNYATLGPEVNSIGEGVTAQLQAEYYPNIYYSVRKVMRLDEFENDESLIPGWLTTGKSRHEIITSMDADLTDDLVEINNPFFVQEAYTFIYNEQNKPVALGKEMGRGASARGVDLEDENSSLVYNDDSILGACIGNEIRKTRGAFKGDLPFAT